MKSGEEKVKMPMSFDDMMGSMNMDLMQSEPICAFQSIRKNNDGSFKISYAPAFMNDLIGDVLQGTGMPADQTMKLNKADITVTPKNGMIGSMKADMDMSVTVEDQKLDMTMTMDCDVTATGSSVKVTLPNDLDTYKLAQ